MKRRILILALALVFVCSVLTLTACNDDSLDKAKQYLEGMYLTENDPTMISGNNYDLIGSITLADGKTYTITWKANVDATKVKITEADGKYHVEVTKDTTAYDYTLTATIANDKGVTVTSTFECAVPAKSGGTTEQPTGTVSIDLKGTTTRKSYSADAIVHEANGIKVTNSKAESTSDCYDQTKEYAMHCYKGSTLKIECASMVKIVITCDDMAQSSGTTYYSGFEGMTVDGATITRDVNVITITFANPVNEFTSGSLTSQIRINSIEVTTGTQGIPNTGTTDAEKLAKAKQELENKYKTNAALTSGDNYDLVADITVDGVKYTVAWTAVGDASRVNVTKGTDKYTVTVNKGTAAYNYILSATITDAKNNTATLTLNASIPAQGGTNPGPSKTPVETFRSLCAGEADTTVAYLMAMYHGKNEKIYFATGAMESSGKYLDTTDDPTKVGAVVLTQATGGFYVGLMTNGASTAKYITLTGSTDSKGNAKATISLTDTATTVFHIGDNKILYGVANGNNFALGTYYNSSSTNVYTTMAANSDYYLTGDNASKVDTEQFVARLIPVASLGDLGGGDDPGTDPGTDPVTPPSGDKGSQTNPYTVADVLAINNITTGNYSDNMVYGKGYVVGTPTFNSNYNNYSIYIADTKGGSTTILLYGAGLGTGISVPKDGDQVTVYGYLKNHNGSMQFGGKGSDTSSYPTIIALTSDGGGGTTPGTDPGTTPVTPPAASDATASIDLKGTTTRTSYSADAIVHDANGIKVTNSKASASTNCYDQTQAYAMRCYQGSTIKVEYTGMVKIVITCDDYVQSTTSGNKTFYGGFEGMTVEGATITQEGVVITITFDQPVNEFISGNLASQTRINSIDVYTE